jgi:DNA-binding response OmpR family regulator
MKTEIVRVLLVEDNPDAARIICEEFKDAHGDKFKLECVGRLSEVLRRIDKGRIDVILLDLSLPDSQGYETFARVHTHVPDVPIIVLSGNRDELLAVKTVQAGAQDYLIKGEWDISGMVNSIYYAMERQRAVHIFTN